MRKIATTGRRKRGIGVATEALAASPLRQGAVVSVYRIDPRTGALFIEGRGVIERRCRRPHFFYVRFDGEKVCRIRFVLPWQYDPERCLALLRAFWEASCAPPSVDEFFPTPPP